MSCGIFIIAFLFKERNWHLFLLLILLVLFVFWKVFSFCVLMAI